MTLHDHPVPGSSAGNINTAEYWDAVYRREFESGVPEHGGGSRDYGPIHDAIVSLVPDGARVLDIACGPGLLCRKIRQRRPATRVMGVDHSPFRIRRNLDRDRELDVEYRCIDIRTGLPHLPAGFDVVTLCEVIEHLDEPGRVVDEAAALLAPGGLLVVSCPHDDEIPDPEHVRAWGHDELFHLMARHGEVVSFRHFPPPYFSPWMLAWTRLSPPAGEARG